MQECSWVRDEMKCRFCGGIVNLTDSVCPHCGKENPLGKKYNADMKKYQESHALENVWLETELLLTEKEISAS